MVFNSEKFFEKLDMYGQPIQFSYNKKSQFTTTCGGCVSIIIISFLIAYMILLLLDITNKKFPVILTTIKPDPGNILNVYMDPKMQYPDSNQPLRYDNPDSENDTSFQLSVGFYVNSNLSFIPIDPEYFSLNITVFNITNSKTNLPSDNIYFAPCERFYDINKDDDIFVKYSINRTYCIYDEFKLQGDIKDPNNNYLNIEINKCSNNTYKYARIPRYVSEFADPYMYYPKLTISTHADIKKFKSRSKDPYPYVGLKNISDYDKSLFIVCRPAEEITSLLSQMKIVFYFTSNQFNLTNYKTPISRSFQTREIFPVNNLKTYANYYFGRSELKQYGSILPSFIDSTYTSYFTTTLDSEFAYYEDANSRSNAVNKIKLFASTSKSISTISYNSILDVLGLVGGLSKILIIAGAIIVAYVSSFRFRESLINNFYSVIDPKKMKFYNRTFEQYLEYKYDYYEMIKNKTVAEKYESDDSDNELNKFFNKDLIKKIYNFQHRVNDSLENENEEVSNDQNSLGSYKDFVKYEIIYEVFKSEIYNKISFSFFELIRVAICYCCMTNYLKSKMNLFNFANNRLSEDTDFLSIVQSAQEFDSFKKVFFEEDQLNIFNSVVNRPITTDQIKEIERKKAKIMKDIKKIKSINKSKFIEKGCDVYNHNLKKIENWEKMYNRLDQFLEDDEDIYEDKSKFKKLEETLNDLLNNVRPDDTVIDQKLIENLAIDKKILDDFIQCLKTNIQKKVEKLEKENRENKFEGKSENMRKSVAAKHRETVSMAKNKKELNQKIEITGKFFMDKFGDKKKK